MAVSVLVPKHIKGYMVLLSRALATQVLPDVSFSGLVDDSAPYFFLWKEGFWSHNSPEIEVRFQQSYGRDEWHVFYGRMRSRDEYNRAHLMVAGHSPSPDKVKRTSTGKPDDLLQNLVIAVKNLNDYQDRERIEERSAHPLLRAWKWFGTSPDEDRMRLPWSVVIAVVADLDEWEVDSDNATIPGFFTVGLL